MKMFVKQSLASTLLVLARTSFDNAVVAFQSPRVSSPFSTSKSPSVSSWNTLNRPKTAFHSMNNIPFQFQPRASTRASNVKVSRLSMVNYDELMERLPSKKVIDAVENSPSEKVVASGEY